MTFGKISSGLTFKVELVLHPFFIFLVDFKQFRVLVVFVEEEYLHVEQVDEVFKHVQITQVNSVNLSDDCVEGVQIELHGEELTIVAESNVKNMVYHVSHRKQQNIRVLVFGVVQTNKQVRVNRRYLFFKFHYHFFVFIFLKLLKEYQPKKMLNKFLHKFIFRETVQQWFKTVLYYASFNHIYYIKPEIYLFWIIRVF